MLTIVPSGTVCPGGGTLVFPHVTFDSEDFSIKEQTAINFHLALLYKLISLMKDIKYHNIYRPLSRLAFSIYNRIQTAINLDHAHVQSANDELVSLVKHLEAVDSTFSQDSILDAYSKFATQWDSTTDDNIDSELIIAMRTIGLAHILASPTIYPTLKAEVLRRANSQPNPALSTIFKASPPAASGQPANNISATPSTQPTSNISTNVRSDPPLGSSTQPENSSKKAKTDITSSSDGFQTPRKYAKPVLQNSTSTIITNSFQPLCDMDTTSDDKSKAPPSPEVISANSDKPQPIFLKQVPEYREILNQISALSPEILLKKAVDDMIRLTPASITHYRLIQRFLSERNVQFFAMRPKSERPKKIVIRGLPTDTDINELKTELSNLGFAIHRISPMRNFKTKVPYPNFIVDIFKNEAISGVFQIGNLLGYQVSISNYTSTHPKQCYKCQRWGHSSDICSFSEVCLKCSGPHLSRTCNVPREKICCANCSQNHCSNFSQCPKNPKFIKDSKLSAEKEAAISKISSFPANLANVRTGINYASATANRRSTRTSQQQAAAPLNPQSSASTAPPKDDHNFPPLNQQSGFSSTSTMSPNNSDLDSTILKLERIRDLLLQIKSLSQEVHSIPGLQGLFSSLVA